MQVGAVLEAVTFWLPRRCGGFDGKGVGLSHTHLTVTLLPRRLLNRETGCGKKAGGAGIFCLPGTPRKPSGQSL